MSRISMVMGFPGSGKGSYIKATFGSYRVIIRDAVGGKVASLIPAFKAAMAA